MWLLDSRSPNRTNADRTDAILRAVERAFDLECWRWSRDPDATAWLLVYEGEHDDLTCRVTLAGGELTLCASAHVRLAPPTPLLTALQRHEAGIGFVWDARLRALTTHLSLPASTEPSRLLAELHRCARALDVALPAARDAASRPPLRLAAAFLRS
ncbi:hypothetical protein [Roseiterribacter gracilis]|uniref:Uncharacterized protein n=1 Tax=Roseiterribacter gracilis TaxID=2812848 RepID=A0A8S8XCW9_9PROT|nr:hypothetical protein TMPK1_19580 [Rhodospirillales bacterium TMPK1]